MSWNQSDNPWAERTDVIPDWWEIPRTLPTDWDWVTLLEDGVKSGVATLSQGVEFVDDLNANFETLKKYYWLKSDEQIKRLLTRFVISHYQLHIVNQSKEPYEILLSTLNEEVKGGKYKTALFLFWLSKKFHAFVVDQEKRKLVKSYFGTAICNDLGNHPSVIALLQENTTEVPKEEFSVTVNLLKA